MISTNKQERASPEHDVFIRNFDKFQKLLNTRDLVDKLVSARIVTVVERDSISLDSILKRIDSALNAKRNDSFYQFLDIIEQSGKLDLESLVKEIRDELAQSSLPQGNAALVDFTIDDQTQVNDLFFELVAALGNILRTSKCNFAVLRSACIKPDFPATICNIPKDFCNRVRATHNVDELLPVLMESCYCNWTNVRMLEKMAAASLKPEAKQLIKSYKDAVHSVRLKDVLDQIPELDITPDFYSEVKDKWNKEYDDVTVGDVAKHWWRLQKIFDVDEPGLILKNLTTGSIEFHWLIPVALVCRARYAALGNWSELDDVLHLDIGGHLIKDFRLDFATPHEVLDHFTDFLIVSLNDESLLSLMHSRGLCTDHDLEVITSGPTRYHRNKLTLQHVHRMDQISLRVFYELLQESHPHINLPLANALKFAGILSKFEVDSSHTSVESSGFNAMEHKPVSVASRKRRLSREESVSVKYAKSSHINQEFLQLTDKLNVLIQFCDPHMITEHCSSLIASDVHSIKVFPTEYVEKLQKYDHTTSLLRILSSFWNWSDHSVLRALLQSNSEAIRLLDEYDSKVDPLQQLSSYPLPLPSPCMVPSANSTHTVLAVKCAQEYYECLLKHVFDVRSKLMRSCDLTSHCLQLLAAKSSSTVLYWLVPKSVVALISTKVLEYSSILCEDGILEMSIFPGTRITINPVNLIGPLVFLSPISRKCYEDSSSAITELMSCPEEMPEVVNDLLLKVKEKDDLLLHYSTEEKSRMQAQDIAVEVPVREGSTNKVVTEQKSRYPTEAGLEKVLQRAEFAQTEILSSFQRPHPTVILDEDTYYTVTEKLLEKDDSVPEDYQEESRQLRTLAEDVDELEEKLRSRGNPEVISKLEGSVKLPSYEAASKDIDDYTYCNVVIHKELDIGSYGTVYQVSCGGKFMSGSVLHDQLLPSAGGTLNKMIQQFKSDSFVAAHVDHPNVVKYFGVFHDTPYRFPMILQEYVVENLTTFLERTKNSLTVGLKLKLSLEMASGLECLHAKQIVHKSLHPSYVLIDKSGQAKISDFVASQLNDVLSSLERSSVYTAPEVVRNYTHCSYQSDVFSLGVLILQVVTENPVLVSKPKELLQDICKYEPLRQLVYWCISDHVMDRPSATGVCQLICEVQKKSTTVAYEAITSKTSLDFTEAIKSGRYKIRWIDCKLLDQPTWWAHAVNIGHEVYVCGGNSGDAPSTDVFVYHILEDTWRLLRPPGVYYGVPVNIEDKLTIVGGRNSESFKFSAKVLTYDPLSQTWNKRFPDLLAARSRPGVLVHSHYLIVAGGKLKDKLKLSNDIEFLDMSKSPLRWERSVVRLPVSMWDLTVFASDDHFWIVGYGDGDRRNCVYNIAIAGIVSSTKRKFEWQQLGKTLFWECTTLCVNGSIPVLLGGINIESCPTDDICYYDSDSFTWKRSSVTSVSTPRAFPAVSLIGKNVVMVIGGCSDSTQGISERYSLRSVEIGVLELNHPLTWLI